MKKMLLITMLLLLLFAIFSCSTMTHRVGNGPQTGQKIEARQWYVLWGLVPINEVNTKTMVSDAEHYEIKTEMNIIDVIVYLVLSEFSVTSRTVSVTK